MRSLAKRGMICAVNRKLQVNLAKCSYSNDMDTGEKQSHKYQGGAPYALLSSYVLPQDGERTMVEKWAYEARVKHRIDRP